MLIVKHLKIGIVWKDFHLVLYLTTKVDISELKAFPDDNLDVAQMIQSLWPHIGGI